MTLDRPVHAPETADGTTRSSVALHVALGYAVRGVLALMFTPPPPPILGVSHDHLPASCAASRRLALLPGVLRCFPASCAASRRLALLPGLLALFALYLLIPWSTASAQQASQEDTCPGADSAPTPTVVEVGAVPIVVESTTDEYFVLYVRHDLDADTTFEVPVGVTLGQDGATTLTESLEALPKERYRVEKYLVSDPADVDGDCTDDITELADPVGMNPVNPVPTMSFDDGAAAIPNRETYVSLAYKSDSGIDSHLRNLEAVKFHMVDMNTDRPSVYFMNTKTYQRHDDFSAAVGLEVNPLHGHETMIAEMVYHPKAVAPDGSLGVYRFQFGANDVYSFKEISYAFTVLAASMPLLEDNLAYYPMWSKAVPRYHKDKSLYDDSRVDVLLAEDIAFDLDFISLNRGTGFGFLRAMSLGERPNPRDIVIYESLPNELPRVAGIITTVPQTPLSHVNLRAVQDGVPNAFIRDALEAPDIEDLIGSYVQYLVGSTTYYVFAASPSEVDAHYADSRPSEPQTPERDLTVTEITPLSDIEFDDWSAFGVKAANVAVLGTLDFPENTVPDGYAVPFYFYDEFMKHNGFYDDVKELLADPNFQSDFDTQEKELKKLRKKIKKGETPEWMTGALEEMHAGFPAGTSLRYRSSTNNEDLPGFSGAGLYDSKTQHPDETEEDGIAKSLKQVYASLWNFRAFTERDFYRVDHLAAAMGVLVHPNYSDELANGVAVSFDPIRMRYGNYYVNSQLGEDLVTNPDAHSAPEEILLHQGGEYTVLATSNQVQQGQLLMSDAQMDQLRRHLELIHDEFAELYGIEGDEPFAMEIEFKITSDDILSIKQARPWVFGDDAPSENSPATGAPTISGTAQVDETLTADTSGIIDADGLTNVSYSYQWIANDGSTDTDIENATAATYTLVTADEGKTIKVRVSFTDDRGYEETLTSAATATVAGRPNAPATGAPTISGTAQVDETLTADTSGIIDADGLTNVSYSYQWIANDGSTDTDIENATAATYTLVTADEGKTIKVRVSFTDDRGYEETLTSAATATVAGRPNAPATGAPTISGTAQVDETLTADTSGITDADGQDNVSYTYQWTANDGSTDTDIENATAATYTPVTADHGKTIKVRVSFTDDRGYEETLTSAATTTVAPASEWRADMSVVDYGTGAIGAASADLFSNSGGNAGLQAKWLWYYSPERKLRLAFTNNVPSISDLTLLVGDVALALQGGDATFSWEDVDVDWEDGQTLTARIVRDWTSAVVAHNSPASGAPTIDGTAQVGETLTADVSGVNDADGLDDVSYSYQWVSNNGTTDTDIQDAADSTYTLTDSDEGKAIKVKVSFTDDADHEETLTSAATAAVEAKPNSPATGAPTIGGTPQVGETLTVDTSAIADEDGLNNVSYSYQWVANDGTTDTDIRDATDSTYTLTDDDAGKTIKVRVSFTDDADNQEFLTSTDTDTLAATKPGVPGHLNVFPHDAEALDVYWEAPASDGGSDLTGYKVQWKESTDSWDTPADVSEETASGTIHTITGLTDGVEYSVRVLATNGVGDSPPSVEKTGTPRETKAPEMVRPRVDGATLKVLYDEALDEGSAPPTDSFDVRVACTCADTTWLDEESKRAVASVSVDGDTVVLTLVSAATSEDVVVVSYTPPSDAATARTRDLAGNAAAGFNPTEVFNDTDETAESEEDGEREETTEGETPLTVSLEAITESHNGTDAFTFEIRFSEEFPLSYKTLRDLAFTVSGGEVLKAQRLDKPSNIRWLITVEPDSNGDVTIVLTATTDCEAQGAICTEDGRMLSNSLVFTVSGPVRGDS